MISPPSIAAIGTAVPLYKTSQRLHQSILLAADGIGRKQKLQIRKVYAGSGIENRYSVLDEFSKEDQTENTLFYPSDDKEPMSTHTRMEIYEKEALTLAEQAVKQCFSALPSLSLSRISHLITFSCTGMSAPGLDIQLVERLGLSRSTERTSINFMGCYAGINALKTAYHISRSEPDAVVLLVGVELSSLHYQKNEGEDQIIANALFADGSAACIVSTQSIPSINNTQSLNLSSFYSEFEPGEREEMAWRIGNYGFDLRLSTFVPELIKKHIPALIDKLFDRAHISQEDISFYAFHPGGFKILEACQEALHVTKEEIEFSYETLRDYGNMSSVTILFVLKKYLESFTIEDKGKKLLACAFGPGLTLESMIAEIG